MFMVQGSRFRVQEFMSSRFKSTRFRVIALRFGVQIHIGNIDYN